MSFAPFRVVTSRTIGLPTTNIDTDQIIPARFLTTTDRDGLGEAAFRDWRFTDKDEPTDHVLNTVDRETHKIIVAGDNFGCGSSREHAAWALTAYGVRAVISTSFGDIFKSNATKNGLLPVEVDEAILARLLEDEGGEVTIDLEAAELRFGNHVIPFETEPFARQCLLEGTDPLGALLLALPAIEEFEREKHR
ncbi:3-isopropylmalate dehydratase [Parvularcula bermudensis HTCC2503]|uniref:3-isopropylmalate dehydratase n=1 Tax=Parvularcula bermudensis (strain ATCC BAA-594 / HTCC2503 / KCTC 12087) TaxID=314260 RepID=E0THM9_PARBH|nr:3-isopropylmalate dehydratase small subunit [Parvularcula bermudensis]ADM09325.1 3-isopropylmalate dehydratase [Parvularcula bermudensis HTCC2503]